jgi:AcrR family transcriptional regulator
MGRPREHDQATRAALLAAAERLLAEGGPDALSVRRVSEAAGTTTRAVYSLFESKKGLLGALYRAAFRELRGRLLALPETADAAADLVRSGVDGFRAHALAHPHLFRLAFEWPARRTDTTDAHRDEALAAFDILVRRVERAAGRRLAAKEARALALGFHALCQGLASGELGGLLHADLPDARRLWRETLATYVRGFAAASTGAPVSAKSATRHTRRSAAK